MTFSSKYRVLLGSICLYGMTCVSPLYGMEDPSPTPHWSLGELLQKNPFTSSFFKRAPDAVPQNDSFWARLGAGLIRGASKVLLEEKNLEQGIDKLMEKSVELLEEGNNEKSPGKGTQLILRLSQALLNNKEVNAKVDRFLNSKYDLLAGKIFGLLNDLLDVGNGKIKNITDNLNAVAFNFKDFVNSASGAAEHLKKQLSEIKDLSDNIGKNMVWNSAKIGGISVVALAGMYGVKVGWNQIERSLNTPKLIIESSKKSIWQKMRGMFVSPEHLPEMVFAPDLAKRLNKIMAATKNIRKRIKEGRKNVKYRNLLLWGPPGTGKTMFAKLLARSSGMEYAEMSGASFAQFKEGQGITEMNKLFEWANHSKDGVMLFIDEAESFLGGRVGSDVTKESYQILNNFLNHTGTRSDKFMIVCATNHPKFLDAAMPSRFDDSVEVKLPGVDERAKILQMYRGTVLLDPSQNAERFMISVKNSFNDEIIKDVATKTDGLSGRELSGIVNTLVTDAAGTDDGLLNKDLVDDVVYNAIQKNRQFEQQLAVQQAVTFTQSDK